MLLEVMGHVRILMPLWLTEVLNHEWEVVNYPLNIHQSLLENNHLIVANCYAYR